MYTPVIRSGTINLRNTLVCYLLTYVVPLRESLFEGVSERVTLAIVISDVTEQRYHSRVVVVTIAEAEEILFINGCLLCKI